MNNVRNGAEYPSEVKKRKREAKQDEVGKSKPQEKVDTFVVPPSPMESEEWKQGLLVEIINVPESLNKAKVKVTMEI